MFLLIPLVTVTLFTILVIPRQRATLMRSLDTHLSDSLAAIVSINNASFAKEDYSALVEINTRILKENPDIRYLVTSRAGGASILHVPGSWQVVDPWTPEHLWMIDRENRILEHNPLTGERVYHFAFPVRFYNLEWGWIFLGVSTRAHDTQIMTMYLGTLAVGAGCLILSACLAWLFTRRIAHPLLHLKAAAERIRAGELEVRATVRTGDEVEDLADSFNAMADSLKLLQERLEARVRERTLELQRSEERYRVLFENSAEAIFVLKDGRVRFWNQVLGKLVGIKGDQLTGAAFADLVFEQDRMAFLELMARAEAARAPVSREGLRLLGPSGEAVWVDVNCVAIRWDEDPALVFFAQDITESRDLQGQLFHAQKMEALGTLAGGIAHDFNNLLGGILGYVSLLQLDKDPGGTDFQRLAKIETQINSATGLTRQLLGFARGGTYEARPRDLNLIVQSAMELFGRTKREIEVRLDLQPDGCIGDCDRGQIEQVLLNLFVNAAQAMAHGGILTVRTRTRDYGEDLTRPFGQPAGRYVEISVGDTGVGMDEPTQARIFEPFFTTKKVAGGVGLGLASVYGIIKNHRGLIHVQSRPGHGSTFTVALPRSQDLAAGQPGGSRHSLRAGEGTVLVVEDQEIIRSVAKDMLEMLGYRVFTAEGGADGVAVLEAHRDEIDLVILDMIMPGMSGKETFPRLRAVAPGIPVLLASGYSLEGEVAALLATGANGFLQKPFSAAQLSEKIIEIRG